VTPFEGKGGATSAAKFARRRGIAQEGAQPFDIQSRERQGMANVPTLLQRFAAVQSVRGRVGGADGFSRRGFGTGGVRPRLLVARERRLTRAPLFGPALGPHPGPGPLW